MRLCKVFFFPQLKALGSLLGAARVVSKLPAQASNKLLAASGWKRLTCRCIQKTGGETFIHWEGDLVSWDFFSGLKQRDFRFWRLFRLWPWHHEGKTKEPTATRAELV